MTGIFTIRGDRPAKRIQDAFENEAKNRPRDFIREDYIIWRTVNDERAKLGKGPVSVDAVCLCIHSAMGRIDFSSKMALYCEELVLKE